MLLIIIIDNSKTSKAIINQILGTTVHNITNTFQIPLILYIYAHKSITINKNYSN